MIRSCTDSEKSSILKIINAGAQRYRGILPADRWKEPYMEEGELQRESDAGVSFSYEQQGELVAVMGAQHVLDVMLIRHAYVHPDAQRSGLGSALLKALIHKRDRPVLVSTWADSVWAIRFCRKHGFTMVSPSEKIRLLKTYWTVPERQIETSVVLADAASVDENLLVKAGRVS